MRNELQSIAAGVLIGLILGSRAFKTYKEETEAKLRVERADSRRAGYEEGWAAASNFPAHIERRYRELFFNE